jgi:hypothetical protein
MKVRVAAPVIEALWTIVPTFHLHLARPHPRVDAAAARGGELSKADAHDQAPAAAAARA